MSAHALSCDCRISSTDSPVKYGFTIFRTPANILASNSLNFSIRFPFFVFYIYLAVPFCINQKKRRGRFYCAASLLHHLKTLLKIFNQHPMRTLHSLYPLTPKYKLQSAKDTYCSSKTPVYRSHTRFLKQFIGLGKMLAAKKSVIRRKRTRMRRSQLMMLGICYKLSLIPGVCPP